MKELINIEKKLNFKVFKTNVNFTTPKKEFNMINGWNELLNTQRDLSAKGYKYNTLMIKPFFYKENYVDIDNDFKGYISLVVIDVDIKNFTTQQEFKTYEILKSYIEEGKLCGEITLSGGLHIFVKTIINENMKSVLHPSEFFNCTWTNNSLEILIKKQTIISSYNNGYIKGKYWINDLLKNNSKEQEEITKEILNNLFYEINEEPQQEEELQLKGGYYDLPEKVKVKIIIAILKKFNPDCDYNIWMKIGTIIKGFLNTDTAFKLFDWWSSKGKKYDGKNIYSYFKNWDESKNHFGHFKKMMNKKDWIEISQQINTIIFLEQ